MTELIKWTCTICGDTIFSNPKERYKLNYCKCKKSGCDAEETYIRFLGNAKFISKVNV